MPQPNIDVPSVVDVINFLFEPGPAGDTSVGDLIQSAADSSPMFGPQVNPLFGKGQAIGEAVDAIGLLIYMAVNHVEVPYHGSGTPPPIVSTPNIYTPMPIRPPTPSPATGTPSPP